LRRRASRLRPSAHGPLFFSPAVFSPSVALPARSCSQTVLDRAVWGCDDAPGSVWPGCACGRGQEQISRLRRSERSTFGIAPGFRGPELVPLLACRAQRHEPPAGLSDSLRLPQSEPPPWALARDPGWANGGVDRAQTRVVPEQGRGGPRLAPLPCLPLPRHRYPLR
jgi:hypothetical protein